MVMWRGISLITLHLNYLTLIGLDKSSDEINFKKNTTLLSFTDMFRQLPLPSSV